jgi:hypothetical protein
VAWDRFLIAEPEGPSFISRTVAHAVWTGDARDTRPISDMGGFSLSQRKSIVRPSPKRDILCFAWLNRPGGNITGVTFVVAALGAKQLEHRHQQGRKR